MSSDAPASRLRSLVVMLLLFTATLSGLVMPSGEATAQPLIDFPHRQEIAVPIDTGQPGATYQP